jgi:hypothetical protein
MCTVKTIHVTLLLIFSSGLSVFGQWSAAKSGTTSNLNGAYLLDSGIRFAVGEAGSRELFTPPSGLAVKRLFGAGRIQLVF